MSAQKCGRCHGELDPKFGHECPADYVGFARGNLAIDRAPDSRRTMGVVDLTPDWENMSDEAWAASLAQRIMGATGETWFENGVAKAIEVAMARARKKERASLFTEVRTWLREGFPARYADPIDAVHWAGQVMRAIEVKFTLEPVKPKK